jgi:hypothetical protein
MMSRIRAEGSFTAFVFHVKISFTPFRSPFDLDPTVGFSQKLGESRLPR